MTGQALSGRRIVVLGGTGGLGHEVTARFRDDGASVVVADARPPREDRRHDGVEYITVDVLDEASVAAAFATSPPPQAIVNLIGGYTPPQPLSGLDVSVVRQQLELNLVTAAIVTKHAMPVLAAQDGGALVHVSSRVAMEKGENGFAYSVSKLGVVRLVEAAAAEGREQGVRVNCIMPSIIDTPANRAAMPDAKHHRWPSRLSWPPCSPSWSRTRPSSSPGQPSPSTAGPRPMAAMRFDAATSRRVEASYATPDVVEQRRIIIGALSLQPGERVLDIGSGPGFLACEMASAVGPSGSVTGIDPSQDMLSLAAGRAAPAHVTFGPGDATDLPFADGTFDAVTSTQVYEYVADMPRALSEARRVLRRGGRLLVLDTDWDSIVWASSDADRMRRVLSAWDEHLADPHLPRRLAGLMADAGLESPTAGWCRC
jgi:NAD(P)-dependent dehydrogenase (short-subunit alcohol dehydrogenase family)